MVVIAVSIAIGIAGAVAGMLPVRVDAVAEKAREGAACHWETRVRWLLFKWRMASDHAPARRTTRSSRRKPGVGRGVYMLRAALGTPGFKPLVVRALRDLARLARPEQLDAHARVGFDDPAATGIAFGCLCALAHRAPIGNRRWRIEPDFSGQVFEGYLRARWSLRPLTAVWPVVRLAASPVTWRALRSMRRETP